jgi:vitamin B12 transporter
MIVQQHRFLFQRRRLAVALLAILVPLSAAHAQAVTEEPDMVVTGVRHAQTVNDSLASVTVITRADIEKSPELDVIGLLAQQAGIDVSRTGGPGQSSTVFMRGANSNQTLVLIDGIRVASVSNGVFDFANIPLDQIERIEIVRGPRAAFWGSDAIGGVIQIFTRNPTPLEVRAEGGTYQDRGAEVSFATPANDSSHLGITLGDEQTRGFPAENATAFGYDPTTDAINDEARNRNGSLRGSLALGSQTLSMAAIDTSALAEFAGNGTPDTSSTARNSSGGVNLAGPLTTNWSQSLTLGRANEDLATPAFGDDTISHRTTLDWVNTINAVAHGTLSFGANWQREQGTSIDLFGESVNGIDYDVTQSNTAGFVGYDANFGSQLVELALRHDHNSQFGDATIGNAAWGWQINQQTKLRVSWGQGFDAPSFDELYSPGFFGEFAGNPALQPERSQSVEAGLDFKASNNDTINLSGWRTRVHDLIDFDGPNFDAENIDRADLDGVELSYRHTQGAWSAGSSITVQDPRDADTDQLLLRRPRRKIAADVRYDFGNGVDLSVDGLAASARNDFGGEMHGYAVLNLAAGWNFHPGWRAELRLNNLFDENYELAQGYNTPGRNGQMTLIWKPGDK